MSLVWVDLETDGLSPDCNHILEVAAIVTDDAFVEVARFERVVYSPIAQRVLNLAGTAAKRPPNGVAGSCEWQHKYPDQILQEVLRQPRDGDVTYVTDADFDHIKGRRVGDGSSLSIVQWVETVHAVRIQPAGVDPYVIEMHSKNGLWERVPHGEALDTVDRDLAAFITEHAVKTIVKTFGPDGTSKFVEDKPQLAGSTISFDRGFIARHLPRAAKTLHYRNVDVSTLNELAKRRWPALFDGRPRKNAEAVHRGMADIEESLEVMRYYDRAFNNAIDGWVSSTTASTNQDNFGPQRSATIADLAAVSK